MYSSSSLFLVLAAAIALCSVDAWTATSSASSFGGRSLTAGSNQVVVLNNGSSMEMKKGKPNVPPQMRGQYARQQEMAQMQQQMRAASVPGDDGLPVFNLYVRSKSQKIWYPCGSFKGDDRSAALAKSYSEGGMLSGISKKQLDGGISGSLYSDLAKLKDTVMRAYPQLRKKKEEMEFGYKLAFNGLPEDKAKEIVPVEPKEAKGPLDGIRNIFS
mmetsp:Transcript_6077/g.17267  ORF Transcript_6077/g.17267 Transcript_6077/m.17267 type:complete len:215 (+) Transcript_6077:147-791(+)